jgi:hypothetical protein
MIQDGKLRGFAMGHAVRRKKLGTVDREGLRAAAAPTMERQVRFSTAGAEAISFWGCRSGLVRNRVNAAAKREGEEDWGS